MSTAAEDKRRLLHQWEDIQQVKTEGKGGRVGEGQE